MLGLISLLDNLMGLVRMGTLPVTCEIVEGKEGTESRRLDNYAGENCMPNSGNKYCIEDDINRLFEAIDLRNYVRSLKMKCDNGKRPMSVSSTKLSGIGISDHVNLKQALRGLCISHASETAAMKRFSKPSTSKVSEAGTIKRLYSTVVVEANASSSQINDCTGFEISLVPETAMPSEAMPENLQQKADACSSSVLDSNLLADGAKAKLTSFRLASSDQIVPFSWEIDDMKLVSGVEMCASSIGDSSENVADLHETPPDSSEASVNSPGTKKVPNRKLHLLHLNSISGGRVDKLASNEQCLIEPALKNKSLHKKNSTLKGSTPCNRGCHNDLDPCISNRETNNGFLYHNRKGAENPFPSFFNSNGNDFHASTLCKDSRKLGFGFKCSKRTRNLITKNDKTSRLKEKSSFSQSSKSSIGECSSSTSFTDESSLSGSYRSDHRPQMSKDLRWKAVRLVQHKHGKLNLSKFKFLRRIGCGDIGTVYLAELMGTNCSFAIKVMDNEFLASRKKMFRAQTEKEILQMLDHPFLPTLYAHFVTESLSCLVMEYCPGGDLHVLRQRQPCRNFSEPAARFYAAEVLLALEYLHMLGIIYRDLKPENILVREDGHIMLTDFDLSLRCAANPILLISSSSTVGTTKKISSPCSAASCMHPFCLQPSWQVPCFSPLIISSGAKSRKMKSDPSAQINSRPQVVVEPTDARSNSFVGTHEYLAPEIVKGESHGNAVDWWTFGIFLFELLYGKTPFKGSSDEDTLNNIASQSLKFPTSPMVSFHARDLIRRLLVKDPENRFGSVKGAAEIKHHPFFEGLNWALIRCAVPPEMPKSFDFGSHQLSMPSKRDGTNYLGNTEYCTVFDLF